MTEEERNRMYLSASVTVWEKVKREVARLGGTVGGGQVGRWWRLNLEAPAGHVWNAAGDTTSLLVEWRTNDGRDRYGAASDALARVRLGVSSGR